MESATKPIGFIGLGAMGVPMALNLLKSGVSLLVWNRSRTKAADIGIHGAHVADSVDNVFAQAEIVILFFRETVAPIAHTALGLTRIDTQDDLARQVLLEFDDPGRPWLHWHDWLAGAGWRNVKPKGMLRFNQYDQVVQSALAGQGIALGRLELVQPLLQGKHLMQLPTVLQCPVNEHAYWLIQANPEPRADVAAVVEWITSEAQANTRLTAD